HGDICSIAGIISRQRNVGISAQRAGHKSATKIDNLQSVRRDEQSSGEAIERQLLSEKFVIHSIGAIHGDLEMRVLAPAKLVYSVSRNSGRVPKLVRQNGFPKLRVDPKNGVSGMQRAFDI